MAVAFVQSKSLSAPGTATTIAVTWTSNTTTGNLICLFVTYLSSTVTVSSVADSQTNTYTQVDFDDNTNGRTDRTYTFYAKNITGGATPTVTVTFSGSVNATLIVHEVSGCDTSSPLDQHKIVPPGYFSSTSTDALSTGNVTTTTDGQYIWGVNSSLGYTSTFVAGTNYTGRETGAGGTCSEDRVQTSAGAIAVTFTMTSASGIYSVPAIMTFKAAAAAGGLKIPIVMGQYRRRR